MCPDKACEMTDCPKCVNVCKTPHCVTHCQSPKPECESVCAEPNCDWKCSKPLCPKPKCELVCENPTCRPQVIYSLFKHLYTFRLSAVNAMTSLQHYNKPCSLKKLKKTLTAANAML
jgi:hypothetical protein